MPPSQSFGFCHFFKKQTSHFFCWFCLFVCLKVFVGVQCLVGPFLPPCDAAEKWNCSANTNQVQPAKKKQINWQHESRASPDKASTPHLLPEELCKLQSSWFFVSGRRLSQAGLLHHIVLWVMLCYCSHQLGWEASPPPSFLCFWGVHGFQHFHI